MLFKSTQMLRALVMAAKGLSRYSLFYLFQFNQIMYSYLQQDGSLLIWSVAN